MAILIDKIQEEQEKKKVIAHAESISYSLTCKFCGSDHFIKYGKANDKQVYKCKSCARKFVPNQGFEKMWFNPQIITTTLDLYFKGVSLRKISDHLRQCHSLEVGHATVYRWICKYTELIGTYIETLEPEVGRIWHSDEIKIKVKGEWKWLWNMMDEKTRSQLVSMIAETREGVNAEKTFQQSKHVTSKRPNLVVTDGLAGYKKAFNHESYDTTRQPSISRMLPYRVALTTL